MKAESCSRGVVVLALHVALQLQRFAAGQLPMTLTAGGYGPASLSAAGPRIVWTPPTANARGNFTLTSAASNSSNRYVSFAFATGPNMVDAILVVDCYEIGGAVMLGTSMNSILAGSGLNRPDIPPRSEVQLLSAMRQDDVLTCSFSMQFPPTLEVYVLLATGVMSPTSSASSPRKAYHTPIGRFASASTIGQILSTTAVTSSTTPLPVSSITSMLTAGGFGLLSPSAAGPRIVWTPLTPFARANFTLTSAASSDSASRYVSFAFANAPSMDFAMTVVDCYEVGGTVRLGTSRNVNLDKIGRTNVNDASTLSQLTLLAASKLGGVLTCQFSMDFGSTLDVYVLLASGLMDSASTVSSPIKRYHGAQRFASTTTVATPSAVATVPAEATAPAMATVPPVKYVTAVAAAKTSGATAKWTLSWATGVSSAGAQKIPCNWLVLFVLPLLFGASMWL